MSRIIFLDRDGTVNVERHYLDDPDGVELYPGVAGGIRRLRELGMRVAVITNQSAIGRGRFDEARLAAIHERLRALLAAEGAEVDGLYHCPHTPNDHCPCRKPGTALMERAARELGGALELSFFVGDKVCDLDAGRAIGARTILVLTGYGRETVKDAAARPDHVAADFEAAVAVIEKWTTALAASPREHVERAASHLKESARVKLLVAEQCAEPIAQAAMLAANSIRGKRKVMFCGNGGSAADSQHLAAELTNRLDSAFERPPLPALALSVDSSFLTAHANDYGYPTVFQRQIEALGQPGDLLVGISTSGNSDNVVRAVMACRARAIGTVGFLGGDGGRLRALVDVPVVVPDRRTQFIQEGHIALGHVLCDLIERSLWVR
jgi:histidinol-phosphate phosphatase family protein